MDYQKLAEVIERAIDNKMKNAAAHIRLGTVATVGERAVAVRIDGSEMPATVAKACACSAGDRVVILKEGTQFYAIARIGG